MYATFTCENCFTDYHSFEDFVPCHGDACHEEVCKKNCAFKCKDPACNQYTCENCKSREYMQGYCIDHALFDEDYKNIDYVAEGKTHIEKMRELGMLVMVQCFGNGYTCSNQVEVTRSSLKKGPNFKNCEKCQREYADDPEAFK